MKRQIVYHQRVFDLLKREALFDHAAVLAIEQRATDLGITLPASVLEWYSLQDGISLLDHQDHPIAIQDLYLENDGPRSVLVVMYENQSICYWDVGLDGSDDPDVYVDIDDDKQRGWLRYADSFSTFIYTRVWDWADETRFGIGAQEGELRPVDLDLLHRNFQPLAKTFNYPLDVAYRFQNEFGKILLWHGAEQTDWTITAYSLEGLKQVMKMIWHCGSLRETAYGFSQPEDILLDELRSG